MSSLPRRILRRAARAARAIAPTSPGAAGPAQAAASPPRPEEQALSIVELSGVRVMRCGAVWTEAAAAAVEQETATWLVVARDEVELPAAAALHELVDCGERLGVEAVQPAVLDAAEGTVLDAGHMPVRGSAPPWRILAGHPEIDLPAAAYLVAVIGAPVVALRTETARRLAVGVELETAVARAAGGGAVLPAVRCRSSAPPPTMPMLSKLAPLGQDDAARALRGAGLVIEGWGGGAIPGYRALLDRNELAEGMREAIPRLRRTESRRRWAIRIGAPAGPSGDGWGDTPFACGLAEALERAGQQAFVDRRGAIARPASDYLDDVTVSIRGLYRMPTNPATTNVLWVISHPEWVSRDELESYDLVLASSETWARHMDTVVSVPVRPMLQATDPGRSHSGPPDPALQEDVLFVGRTRGVLRPIVRDAIAAGVDVAIYGDGWEQFVDPRHIRAESLPHARAATAYRSARRVLNDHWDDMTRHGFLSNRLFDAVANGARVVSDPVAGLELFEGAVRAYTSLDELRRLLQDDDGWPDDRQMEAIAARIRTAHSFDARASAIIAMVERVARG